jgi:hypothetical protein
MSPAGGADWGLAEAVEEGSILGPSILFTGEGLQCVCVCMLSDVCCVLKHFAFPLMHQKTLCQQRGDEATAEPANQQRPCACGVASNMQAMR